ncbi:MAG: hypothetical protein JJU36_12470 [Phycisphaeraceae bacterium]|nr:hypothetical protein [Phycisphaeraceae bacterium]
MSKKTPGKKSAPDGEDVGTPEEHQSLADTSESEDPKPELARDRQPKPKDGKKGRKRS